MWRIIEVVIAAQEPLHVETLEYLVNCTTVQRKSAVAQLSLLFPVRDQRLHVFHKSVKDWLVNVERKEETCFVKYKKVHKLMGKRCNDLLNESFVGERRLGAVEREEDDDEEGPDEEGQDDEGAVKKE